MIWKLIFACNSVLNSNQELWISKFEFLGLRKSHLNYRIFRDKFHDFWTWNGFSNSFLIGKSREKWIFKWKMGFLGRPRSCTVRSTRLEGSWPFDQDPRVEITSLFPSFLFFFLFGFPWDTWQHPRHWRFDLRWNGGWSEIGEHHWTHLDEERSAVGPDWPGDGRSSGGEGCSLGKSVPKRYQAFLTHFFIKFDEIWVDLHRF